MHLQRTIYDTESCFWYFARILLPFTRDTFLIFDDMWMSRRNPFFQLCDYVSTPILDNDLYRNKLFNQQDLYKSGVDKPYRLHASDLFVYQYFFLLHNQSVTINNRHFLLYDYASTPIPEQFGHNEFSNKRNHTKVVMINCIINMVVISLFIITLCFPFTTNL